MCEAPAVTSSTSPFSSSTSPTPPLLTSEPQSNSTSSGISDATTSARTPSSPFSFDPKLKSRPEHDSTTECAKPADTILHPSLQCPPASLDPLPTCAAASAGKVVSDGASTSAGASTSVSAGASTSAALRRRGRTTSGKPATHMINMSTSRNHAHTAETFVIRGRGLLPGASCMHAIRRALPATPHWPLRLHPHAKTFPSTESAREWRPPPAQATMKNDCGRSTWTGISRPIPSSVTVTSPLPNWPCREEAMKREAGREEGRERERERDGGRDEQPVHVKTHNTALQVCICARASMQAKLDHLDI